jgi:hypothetical protein
VSGSVSGVARDRDFNTVVYAYTDKFYVQPCTFDYLTAIANSIWGPVPSHNGRIYALLVAAGYRAPLATGSLPAVDNTNVFAVTGPAGAIEGCDVAMCPSR